MPQQEWPPRKLALDVVLGPLQHWSSLMIRLVTLADNSGLKSLLILSHLISNHSYRFRANESSAAVALLSAGGLAKIK